MNDKGLGAEQKRALTFIRSCNGWHGYSWSVERVIASLATRGLVEMSVETKQFRAIEEESK